MTMSESMKAAVLRGWNDLVVEEVPTPKPDADEVLVRVRACGICGTDLKLVQGGFEGRWPPSLPFIIGHEWSGEVVAIGPGAEDSGLSIGDRVVAENHAGCGRCRMCRSGRYNLCELVGSPGYKLYGHTAPGALAEYAVRPTRVVHRIPPNISFLAGALVNQGSLTVHAMRRVGFQAGSTAGVFGPGLLGLLTAAVAKASGAAKVIMVGRGSRLETATQMGCDEVIDYEATDPVEGLRRLTGGRGVDCAFDCSGNPRVLPQAMDAVRRGGKVAVLGLAASQRCEISPDRLVLDEIDLLGIRSSPNAYPAMIELLASGAVDVEPLLSHVYDLDHTSDAFAALKGRDAIRPIIQI